MTTTKRRENVRHRSSPRRGSAPGLPLHGGPLQRRLQLGPVLEHLLGLGKREPLPLALLPLGPVGLLARDGDLVEPVQRALLVLTAAPFFPVLAVLVLR